MNCIQIFREVFQRYVPVKAVEVSITC